MTSAVKEQIKATWTTEQLQKAAATAMVNMYMVNTKMFEKLTPELRTEWVDTISEVKANHYKTLNVKTPIELVKAMAEFETNVYGSKIIIDGDDNKASMEYATCGCYELMKKSPCFSKELDEKLGKEFQVIIDSLAKKFNFKSEMAITGETSKVTFTK